MSALSDRFHWFAVPEDRLGELRDFHAARREHAFLLRCEVVPFAEIGGRLGVSSTQARSLVDQFTVELAGAVRRARASVTRTEAAQHFSPDECTELAAQYVSPDQLFVDAAEAAAGRVIEAVERSIGWGA